MTKIKITVVKKFNPKDVFGHEITNSRGEIVPTCYVFEEGEEFIVENLAKPEDFCGWGWKTVVKDIELLASGENVSWCPPGIIYSSCTDGARPVIFKLERIE
ncbi:MAG: TIGR04076 family protein [Candidatus Thorarchaeota archaeon]